MNKKLVVLLLILSLLTLSGCSNSNIDNNDKNIEVKELTLKISLMIHPIFYILIIFI